MIRALLLPLVAAATLLAGCSREWSTDYVPVAPGAAQAWRLADVRVSVPDTLTTAEDNTLAPDYDVVWHGEPAGDRRAQVRAIVTEGLRRGASGLRGSRPVALVAQVSQFHAVTPAAVARAPSAVHDIRYTIQVVDARSGEILSPPQEVRADLPAFVGAAAVAAAVEGETQKVRITRHLAQVTAGWLGIGPDRRGSFRSIGR